MYLERHELAVTTDGSGDATVYSERVISGVVHQVRYVPDGTSPLATGADVDLTGEVSGVVVWDEDDIGTSAITRAPRQATHGVDGVASLYAAAGEPVETAVAVAGERLKLVVAQGGAAKQGTFHVYAG